jgi:hypothetical protein
MLSRLGTPYRAVHDSPGICLKQSGGAEDRPGGGIAGNREDRPYKMGTKPNNRLVKEFMAKPD